MPSALVPDPLAGLADEQFAYAIYRNCDAWAKYIRDLTTHDRGCPRVRRWSEGSAGCYRR